MKSELLKILKDEYDALDIMTINDKLGLTTVDELRELEEILQSLVKDLTLYETKKGKYVLYEHCPNFKKGVIDINKRGNGYLIVNDSDEEDIFVHSNNLNYALDGDTVLVEVTNFNPSEPEGRVIKVLERNMNNIVGILERDEHGVLIFKPQDKKHERIEFFIDDKDMKSSVEGEVVVLKVLEDLKKNRYACEIGARLGHKDDAGMDIKMICAENGVYNDFPEDALNMAENIPTEVLEKDLVGRVDLRNNQIFTIDGADTKDIDDAISLDMEDGYYILRVSIADVSYYVTENSPLDLEARRRGTSCYPANSVIPMLPHKLSNGICSLNENVDRLALTCEMKIDTRGHVVEKSVYPSIINSKKKMTYDNVNEILEKGNTPPGYENFVETLKNMQELAHIIRNDRTRRGATDFDIDEAKIICDDEGKAIDVKRRERGEGERLIEDFMVIANESVGSLLFYDELPSVYRCHAEPKKEAIQNFIHFCNITGHPIKGKFQNINPHTYQSMLAQLSFEDDIEEMIYRRKAVRSMAKAYYGKENIGHFGLASRCYSHFTSPIRRYPDLQLHRLIHTYYIDEKRDQRTIDYWNNNLDIICEQCSEREVAADTAERECDKMKMAEYMESHVGEEYEATITSVEPFGLFVQLDNLVEGLISINTLDDDTYEYLEDMEVLIGHNTKKQYRIGEKLIVKCTRASKEASQIDFEEIKTLNKELKR